MNLNRYDLLTSSAAAEIIVRRHVCLPQVGCYWSVPSLACISNTVLAGPLAPIHLLPNEILAEIFNQAISAPLPSMAVHRSQIHISSVCVLWRKLLSATPSLWCMLYVRPTGGLFTTPAYSAFLDRSRHLPIQVMLYNISFSPTFQALFRPHYSRISWLKIVTPDAHLLEGLHIPFGMFSRLRYLDVEDIRVDFNHSDGIPIAESPPLEVFNCDNIRGTLQSIPTRALKSVQLTGRGLKAQDVIQFLMRCSVLENLHLDCFYGVEDSLENQAESLVFPPSIVNLSTTSRDIFFGLSLFRNLGQLDHVTAEGIEWRKPGIIRTLLPRISHLLRGLKTLTILSSPAPESNAALYSVLKLTKSLVALDCPSTMVAGASPGFWTLDGNLPLLRFVRLVQPHGALEGSGWTARAIEDVLSKRPTLEIEWRGRSSPEVRGVVGERLEVVSSGRGLPLREVLDGRDWAV